jgi:hypothetical protein
MFRALHYRDYRLLGPASCSTPPTVDGAGYRPVLVYELSTESATAVAFAVVAHDPRAALRRARSAAADRFDKKRILFVTQLVTMSMHFLLAFLVLSGAVQLGRCTRRR